MNDLELPGTVAGQRLMSTRAESWELDAVEPWHAKRKERSVGNARIAPIFQDRNRPIARVM